MKSKLSFAVAFALTLVGTTSADSPAPLRLRVLTYNIHHAEGVDRKLDVERIARVINDVRPDVVALQEVDQGISRTLTVDQPAELARLTKMHVVFGDNIQFGGGGYGNAVLSRFPITSHKNHRLPNRDNGEQRGILEATIALPDQAQPLVLFATHLDHRKDDQERFESAQAINALAAKHARHPTLLAGDLNDTADSRTLREFSKSWTTANEGPLLTVPVGEPDRQIDFILFRPAARWKAIEVQVLPEAVASDHRAVLAVLELRPASAGHQTQTIEGWTVHVRNELLGSEDSATERALELLTVQLREIVRVVPATAVKELRKVPLWFSPEYRGIQQRAEYHPGAAWLLRNNRDPIMAKAVEFTNIRIFERETKRMPNFTLHELAHAYHDRVLTNGFGNEQLKAAFENAKAKGLYEKVERRLGDGRSADERAYAMTNPMEYFAECTEAFFSTNDFFPFTRDQLKKHDPEMFSLLDTLWSGADRKLAKAETTRSSLVGSYSIVVSDATNADAEWKKVVTALAQKYEGAEVVTFAGNVREALPTLRRAHPRYTCFVATSAEAGRQFVADVHRMTRQFDGDPYADTLWGILTGYDAANALKIAQHDEPLTVRKVASGTEVALDMCSQGLWYDELIQHKTVSRKPDGEIEESRGPADTTHALAETLTRAAADLFVTSGHATERDWQIGFRYRNGQFRSEAGHMFGVTTSGERFSIQSNNPKVYLPIGNCLMGHINGPDAMALAWMNDVGVHQMIGYSVLTWYGYSGWGVLDYFVEQPGRYTLTEAFHSNQHALIHRLDTYYDDLVAIDVTPGGRSIPARPPNEAGRTLGLTEFDSRGLLWDRDTVAFYGDPAWQARMAPMDKAYDQKLTIDGDVYTLTITPGRGSDSFKPVNTNGAQRGWRPIVELLDDRISNVKIIEGADLTPVITDDFILIPNPRTVDSSREYRVRFTASRN